MRVRSVYPPVLRDLLFLAAVGVAGTVLTVACTSDARERMMHFFFEVPDQNTDQEAPPHEETPRAAEIAFGNKWPQHVVSRHPPFVERRCQACHDADAGNAPLPDQLTGCKACHPQYFEYRRYGHGPAAGGSCRLCHDMHASYEGALLRAPQTLLCTTCHAAQYTPEALETYHRGLASRNCTACHNPHWADAPTLLLVPGFQEPAEGLRPKEHGAPSGADDEGR